MAKNRIRLIDRWGKKPVMPLEIEILEQQFLVALSSGVKQKKL